jgi:carboxyl-terminal processing protease
MDYEDSTHTNEKNAIMRGTFIALIVILSFVAGLLIGSKESASSIVSNIPFIGDGLDATPNPNADFTDFWKAWNALETNFVATHASSTTPSIKERVFGAMRGLAASYDDPYTIYFPPKEAKEFADNISGSFAGIGMEIDVKDGVLTVIAPLKGTPAESAGIKAGDQIVTIDGKSTDGISTSKAVSKIRGPVGTKVRFAIIRDGKALDIEVVRAIIQVPETEDGLDEGSGVYHIALFEFTSNSAGLFNQAFVRFRNSGSEKLIIDLRGNPGGYLDSAVDIASHFLPKGTTIVTEDFGEKEKNQAHISVGYNDISPKAKIVVLIDGGSASASEILAGALQDANRATIIGMKSFGKGSVQSLIDLGDGSLKITVARWITPAGHWIMDNGITPDIIVPFSAADATAKRDPQMLRAIQFLTTGK